LRSCRAAAAQSSQHATCERAQVARPSYLGATGGAADAQPTNLRARVV
jgi:hypothetical protein